MKKIRVDSKSENGNPQVEGTRLTVLDVVMDCSHYGIDGALNESGSAVLTSSEIKIALTYCSRRDCYEEKSYCGGCSLRPMQDGIKCKEDFINRFNEVRFSESDEVVKGEGGEGTAILLGKPENFESEWRGVNGWEVASRLLQELEKRGRNS